jgi:hypothetical protein
MNGLADPGSSIVDAIVPSAAGLYAIHANASVWRALGLGAPPDDRPLYVGKAEDSLVARDMRSHFADGRTGSSTLRRSFAALLHDDLKLRGTPRNPLKPGYYSNYGLDVGDDQRLTKWMTRNLRIATWASPSDVPLALLERDVIGMWPPPLNLSGVRTPWSDMLSARRRVVAEEARAWRPRR